MLKTWLETKKQNPNVSKISLTNQLKHAFAKASLKVPLTFTPDKMSHSSKGIKVFLDQTSDPQQACKDLLKDIEEALEIETLDLSHNETLLHVVEAKVGLNSLLSLSSLKSIRSLNLSNCSLRDLPDLACLQFLETVDLSNNSLTSCWDLENSHLRSLNIEGNPIEDVTINPNKFPSLEKLTIGSLVSRFISFDLIRKMNDEVLELNVSERYHDNLLLPPPAAVFGDRQKLECYMEAPETYMIYISDIDDRIRALQWLLMQNFKSFETFSLDGQPELVRDNPLVLSYVSLQNITALDISKCYLSQCPHLNYLHGLRSLDISDNCIMTLSEIEKCRFLEHLNIVGNPIDVIDCETGLFETLKTLKLGSTYTKVISSKVLKRTLETELDLRVKYWESLLCPTYAFLSDFGSMKTFLAKPETILNTLPDESKAQAFSLLVRWFQEPPLELDLSDMSALFDHWVSDETNRVLSSPNLDNLEMLILHNCSLKVIPNFDRLNSLETLDLSCNLLEYGLETLHLKSLKNLRLDGNPIRTIEMNFSSLPSLNELSCGSWCTTQISFSVLNRVVYEKLKIIVPREFENYLVIPPHATLGDTQSLRRYLQQPEIVVSRLPSNEKETTLFWLLKQSAEFYSLNLSGQGDLCEKTETFVSLLYEPNLQRIASLSLEDCRLSHIPNLRQFSNLRELSVKNNLLVNIEHDNLPQCLEFLNTAGNPIDDIDIPIRHFPNLKYLGCGSRAMKFVSLEIVKASALQSLDLLVRDAVSLLLPPQKILFEDSLLIDYIKNPEEAISCIADTDKKWEALEWLINKYGDTFRVFSLKGQADLYRKIVDRGYKEVFSKLSNIEHLGLSNCNLTTVIDLSYLNILKSLNLSNNNIRELPQYFSHHTLKELDISGNKIVQVDLGDANFGSLTWLRCGSLKPWNIMPPTLRAVIDGKLKVRVPPDYRKTLLFPKYIILESGPRAIKACLENEELDLTEIKTPNDDLSYYRSLLDNSEKPISSIRLSTIPFLPDLLQNTLFRSLLNKVIDNLRYLFIDSCNIQEFPRELFTPGLTHIDISHNNLMEDFDKWLPPLRELKVQNCKLSKLPELKNLRSLDIQDNRISTLETSFVYTDLKSLNIQGNPIVSIDFSRNSFPKLNLIYLGSPSTKFISSRVLELSIRDQIKIILESEYQHHLILPPAECLRSPSALNRYIRKDSPEGLLTQVESESKAEALMWLMEDERAVATENFDLSGQADLCSRLQQQGLETLIASKKLQNIVLLCLDHCGLLEIPNTENLPLLSTFSVAFNNIKHIDDIRHPTIQNLRVQGNPIERIHFIPSNLPSLIHLTCGSILTQRISRTVLELITEGLNIKFPLEYRDCLKAPSFQILEQGMTAISAYFNKRELDLSTKYFETMSIDFLEDKIQHQERNIKVLKVSGQRRFLKKLYHVNKIFSLENLDCLEELYMDDCGLTEIPTVRHLSSLKCVDVSSNSLCHWDLCSSLNLPNLHTLRLNECGLKRFVDMTYLPLLKHLELRKNKLTDLNCFNVLTSETKLHPLETLDLSDNPVKEIDIDKKSYPVLRRLVCGSPNTHYISFSLMTAISKGIITVQVLELYKKYLFIPSAAELDDAKGVLVTFLEEKVINLDRISDVQERHNAFLWLLEKKHVQYSTLMLTDQSDFLHYEKVDLRYFFNHPSIADIKILYLDSCNLTHTPNECGGLEHLELLDVSNNKLTDIFEGTELSYPKLSKLFLQGNPIQRIEIKNLSNRFPRLKYIKAGSEYTFKIGYTLLGRVASGELKIEIMEDFGKFLVQPPNEVLMLGSKTVKVYLNEGDMGPDDSRDGSYVWRSTTDNVLMFLGAAESGKTSLLQTMKENSPKLTHRNNRTVILEKGDLNLGHNITTTTLDFGGHDIYELEYPMFLRGQNVIVLILVDLSEYSEEKHDTLVTKWLHNCALATTNCKVLFVPSKTDILLPEEVKNKVELMKTLILKSLRLEIDLLYDMKNQIRDNYMKVRQFDAEVKSDRYYFMYKRESEEIKKSIRFFKCFEIKILPTSSQKMVGIGELKSNIRYLVEIREVLLPASWDKILQVIKDSKSQSRFYSSFKQVKTSLAEKSKVSENLTENMEECLRYLSNKGIVCWYKEDPEYIFNKVENVLQLHKQIYRHDLQESMAFRKSFNSFIPNEVEFQEEKDRFLNSGLMRRHLLECLWLSFKLSDDEMTTMIKLLRLNDQCFEKEFEAGNKLATDTSFLQFPWFVQRATPHYDWSDKIPGDHLELCYVYTFLKRFPSTFFERLCARLQQILTRRHDRTDWADGIFVKMGTVKLLIQRHTRNHTNPQLTVRLRAPSTDLISLWELCLKSYNNVVNYLATKSAMVTYNRLYICPHCILRGCSIDSAYKLPLSLVMESRCDNQHQQSCLSPGTSNTEPETVPAALLQPLTEGKQN